jgi:uncharacterized membrane protein YphA (DoxX/SURF4 family)
MFLIRVIVGLVFLLEGALKFAFPSAYGESFFTSIGLPFAHILAPAVGGIEIAGGLAVLFNFYAGDAALALILVLVTALITTKLPVLLGHPIGPLPLPKVTMYGWLSFLHEARVELCLLFGSIAVLVDSGLRVGRRRHWYQGN